MMGVEGWMLGGGEMLHCYHADEAAHHAVHTGRRLTDPALAPPHTAATTTHRNLQHIQPESISPAEPLSDCRINSWYFRNGCLDLVYHQDSWFSK